MNLTLLQKIRERPGLYFGKKSLEYFSLFKAGYEFRTDLEMREKVWKEATGRDFYENYDEAMSVDIYPKTQSQSIFAGLNEFVYSYYNCELWSLNAEGVISKYSSSDEEAFDKFFELLDEFMAHRNSGNV